MSVCARSKPAPIYVRMFEGFSYTGDGDHSQTSAFVAGLTGHCPRCGRGALFKGFAALAPACDVCGLDYSFADPAYGPAVFISFIGGFIVLGAALWTELVFEPPMWVHIAIR